MLLGCPYMWQQMKLKTGNKNWRQAMPLAWKLFVKVMSYMHHGFLIQQILEGLWWNLIILLYYLHPSECICFWQIHRTDQHTEILGKHWYSLQPELFSEFYSWTYSVKVIGWIPTILLKVIFKVNPCKLSPLCLQIYSHVSQTSYTFQVTWH